MTQIQTEQLRLYTCILGSIMAQYRFQDLEIWQRAIELTDHLFDLADQLERKKYFRFAEQLRSAILSVTNNIAEGSGSNFPKDFARFLNFSRRSAFEVANMLIILNIRGLIKDDFLENKLEELDILSRMITKFQRSLGKA